MNEPQLIPIRRAARLLHRCVRTLRRMRDRGELTILRIGGRDEVPAAEIARLTGNVDKSGQMWTPEPVND